MADCNVEREGGVMLIRFNRPEKMNAMGGSMMSEYVAALAEARDDDAIRAVVVTGEGRAWCAGADLGELGGGGGGNAASAPPRPQRLDNAGGPGTHVRATWYCEKPTIAAVNGVAVGGGMGLVSAFDFRIAGDAARFSTMFINRALSPDYGLSWFLPRIVGFQRAQELLMSGRMFGAEEAKELGFVLEVVPQDGLLERAMAFGAELAAKPPNAMVYARRAMHRSLTNTLEEQLEFEWQNQLKNLASDEFKEGVAAFMEKREPDYSRF